MEEILFTKMQGAGNDYIYINCLTDTPRDIPQLSIEMSSRGTSVGADGIILILPSECADFRMRIFNADGSEARMCGNGSRCVGKYLHDYCLTDKTTISLETLAGIRTLELHVEPDGSVNTVTVDMGEPSTVPAEIPVLADKAIGIDVDTSIGRHTINAISMGNPHGVIFMDSLEGLEIEKIGPELECHPMWPDRANIEFSCVKSPSEIEMRVWERGSGETLACGTGACATAVAAAMTGRTERTTIVHLRGGDLKITWADDNRVYMTGPATTVYEGRYYRRDHRHINE